MKYILVYTDQMLALQKICGALAAAGVRYAIVGGHAVALHGAVRGTVDIDIAINWNRRALEKTEHALRSLGLESRLPLTADDVFSFRDEYVNNRNLLAWSFYNPADLSEQVDVLIDYDLKGKSTKTLVFEETRMRILALDDLIEMKQQSGRAQDLADVEALEKLK